MIHKSYSKIKYMICICVYVYIHIFFKYIYIYYILHVARLYIHIIIYIYMYIHIYIYIYYAHVFIIVIIYFQDGSPWECSFPMIQKNILRGFTAFTAFFTHQFDSGLNLMHRSVYRIRRDHFFFDIH